MIAFEDVSLHFGERALLKDVSFNISGTDRIGLVGANGSGKTTLLRMMYGLFGPDSGQIKRANYLTVGYLPQEELIMGERSLYDEVESVFVAELELRKNIDESSSKLHELSHESDEYMDLLHCIGEWELKLEAINQGHIPAKIEQILTGLGFKSEEFSRSVTEFSGGWQMRIALAKLLLAQPSLMLLDEPTNHLDLSSLCWLEQFLKNYSGSYVIVSHDRAFLDSLCRKTFVLRNGRLDIYSGNYSYSLEAAEMREGQQQQAFKSQQKKLEQAQRFVERFRYKASKAKQVQSRIKAMEKMELVELEEDNPVISLSFPPVKNSGQVVMDIKGLAKSYGDKLIFQNLNLQVEKGERIAIVGNNGMGKSTLLRIMAGEEPFQAGERVVGHNVTISYYSQKQVDSLDMDKTIMENLEAIAAAEDRPRLRSLLGAFLFRGDDVFKKVKVLSGGEKCRVALARTILQKGNYLLLDEPTNHLDMISKEIMQGALSEYEGTLVIVSHDRAFLDPLVSKVWEVGQQQVRQFWGNVSYYLEKTADNAAAEATKTTPKEKAKGGRKGSRDIRREIAGLEKNIIALEEKLKIFEKELQAEDFFKQGKDAHDHLRDYETTKQQLADLNRQWEDLVSAQQH